jgi:hypothetical protein
MLKLAAYCLPSLPGFEKPKTYAPAPVWRNSTTDPLRFQPMKKKQAAQLWHEARRFERATRQPGHQDGALGRNGLAVLYALLFDFLNYASGRLDPSIATIASAANISERSASRGLASLKASGVLNWARRCVAEIGAAGRMVFKQLTNAYAVLPVSQWLGHTPRPPAPPPEAGTWGDHPPLPSIIEQAASAASLREQVRTLELAEAGSLDAALARLGRTLAGRGEGQDSGGFTGLPA